MQNNDFTSAIFTLSLTLFTYPHAQLAPLKTSRAIPRRLRCTSTDPGALSSLFHHFLHCPSTHCNSLQSLGGRLILAAIVEARVDHYKQVQKTTSRCMKFPAMSRVQAYHPSGQCSSPLTTQRVAQGALGAPFSKLFLWVYTSSYLFFLFIILKKTCT